MHLELYWFSVISHTVKTTVITGINVIEIHYGRGRDKLLLYCEIGSGQGHKNEGTQLNQGVI